MSAVASADLGTALRALVDDNRRTILSVVRDRPHSVGEIVEAVDMSQQTVSHHLRVLRDAGLVTESHKGTRHLFVVRADGLKVLDEFLSDFWPTKLSALKSAAEARVRRAQGG